MYRKAFLGFIAISVTIVFVISATPAYCVVEFRMGHHHAVGGMIDNTANKFAELVEEKTGGEVKIKIFPAAQLGQERELFDLLHQGGVDATITSLGYLDKYYPPMAVTSLPFVFRDWGHGSRALESEFGTALKEGVMAKSNAQVVGFLEVGFRHLMFRREPITELAGMKGVKMRSPEAHIWIRMYELMGAKPTPITWGEVYTSLQTGVVAGFDTPAFVAVDMKFYEVCKSLVLTNHMFAIMGICVNKNKMAKLSPELKKAVEDAGYEAAKWVNDTIMKPGEATAQKTLEGKGVKVVAPKNPSEWSAAMNPLWDEISKKYPGTDKILQLLLDTK